MLDLKDYKIERVAPIVQHVVCTEPPLFGAIDAVFKVRGKPILFAFGAAIFNPMRVKVPAELIPHEGVHGARQLAFPGGTIAWWAQYMLDPTFRLQEELPAHLAEFEALCKRELDTPTNIPKFRSRRAGRRVIAAHVARKLAAPLYGNLITVDAAKRLLLEASPATDKLSA